MPAFASQTPLRNPYETFTGKDLDSFVADIKSKVNNALKPPRRSSPPRFRGSLVAASLPVLPHLNPLYQHKESPLDLTSTAEDPTAGDTTLNWSSPDKGKARAVDEGPGVEALRNLRPSSQSPRVATKTNTGTPAQSSGFPDDDYPPEDSFRYRRYYYDDKQQPGDEDHNVEDEEEQVETESEGDEGEYGSDESVGHTQTGKDYMEDEDGAIVIDDSDDEEPVPAAQGSSPDWDTGADPNPTAGDDTPGIVDGHFVAGTQPLDAELLEEEQEENGPIQEELHKEGFDAIRPAHIIHQESRSGYYDVYDQDAEEDELDDEEQVPVYDEEQARDEAVFESASQDILPITEDEEVIVVEESDGEHDGVSVTGQQGQPPGPQHIVSVDAEPPNPHSAPSGSDIASNQIAMDLANFPVTQPTSNLDPFQPPSTFSDAVHGFGGTTESLPPLLGDVPTLDPNQFLADLLAGAQQGFPIPVPVGLSVPSVDPILASPDEILHQLANPLSASPAFSPLYEGGLPMTSFPPFPQTHEPAHHAEPFTELEVVDVDAIADEPLTESHEATGLISEPPVTPPGEEADMALQPDLPFMEERSAEADDAEKEEQEMRTPIHHDASQPPQGPIDTDDTVRLDNGELALDAALATQISPIQPEHDSIGTTEGSTVAETLVIHEKQVEATSVTIPNLSPQSEVTATTVMYSRRSVEVVEMTSDDGETQLEATYVQPSVVEEPRSTAASHHENEPLGDDQEDRISVHTVEEYVEMTPKISQNVKPDLPEVSEGEELEQGTEENGAPVDEVSSLDDEDLSVEDDSVPKAQEVEINEDNARPVIDLTSPFSPIGKDRRTTNQTSSSSHSETEEEESERILLDSNEGEDAEGEDDDIEDINGDPFNFMGTGKGGPGEVDDDDDDDYEDGEDDEEIEDDIPVVQQSANPSPASADSTPPAEADDVVETPQHPKVIISPPEPSEKDEASPETAENEADAEEEEEEEGSSADSDAASAFSDDDSHPAVPDTSPSKASTSEVNTSLAGSPTKSSIDGTPSADRTADMLPPPLARLTSLNLYRHHHGPVPAPAPQALRPIARPPPQEEDRKSETHEQRSRSATPSIAPSRSSQVSGSTRERERDPNAAVTRSQCKFHKIAIPVPASSDEEEGETTEQEGRNAGSSRSAARGAAREPRKVIFIVPYCSLSNQEKIAEEHVEVQGEASRLENETKVAIPEFAEHVIGSYVLASLLALVGHHIMQDACAWLPSPDEELAYQRYLKKRRAEAAASSTSRSSLSRRHASRKSATSTARPKSAGGRSSRPGPSRVTTARPKSKSLQKPKAEEKPAEPGVPKVEISKLFDNGSDSDSLTELSDSDSSEASSSPNRQPASTPAKRRRTSGRRITDTAYKPPVDGQSESEGSDGERPRKRRRRSTRHKANDVAESANGAAQSLVSEGPKGKKRARPTAAPASVQEAEGTAPPRVTKRRRKNVDTSVNGDSDPEDNETGEPHLLKAAKDSSLLPDSPAKHTRSASRASTPVPPEPTESFLNEQTPSEPAELETDASQPASTAERKNVFSWIFRK
ncbi:hypothetical protein FRC05_009256 [Tulasnella sp. 425]|nr:hypothetical protein FRC05_009256 [Tulasnella sp. 425]